MNLSLPNILNCFPRFNWLNYGTTDFWVTTETRSIDVLERRQKRKGYYVSDKIGDFIFIDSRLRNFRWLWVAFHELTHAILHFPSPFFAQKQQFEANAFSIMLICPAPELDVGSEMRRTARYCHDARFILKERERIHFMYQDFGFSEIKRWV